MNLKISYSTPMQTELLQDSDITLAAAALKRGSPVVFPTETVYGLGAPVFNEGAIRKVFEIKGRPSDNPLIVHIAALEDAGQLSDHLSEEFYRLAKAFWPGPLTIVVRKRDEVPGIVSGNLPTVAIRMPSHPTARKLIAEVGEPLVAPSANISGRPSPTSLTDCLEDLDGKVEFAIDGGACEVGIESTVISLFHPMPTLLRPGKITKEMLEEVLGSPVLPPPTSGPVFSPGMKYRHYAPKAPIRLIFEKEDLTESFVLPTAKNLYAELRKADRAGAKEILLYCDREVLKDAALMNRILRASGQIG